MCCGVLARMNKRLNTRIRAAMSKCLAGPERLWTGLASRRQNGEGQPIGWSAARTLDTFGLILDMTLPPLEPGKN